LNIEHRTSNIKHRRGDGSVLILALWVLFFLAALAVAVGAHVSAALRLAGAMHQDARAYPAARAGVAYAALQVACNTNQWDGWGEEAWNSDTATFSDQEIGEGGLFSILHTVETPEGVVTNAGLVGAESRINIGRRPDAAIFQAFMTRVGGVSGGQAESLYDALLAYRKAKLQRLLTMQTANGYPESDHGEDAPLDSVHELLLVDGMDESIFALIEPYVTVFGSGFINANTASSELLLSCAEAYPLSKDRIVEIIAERESAPLRSSAQLSSIAFLSVRSTAFYGLAVGRTARGDEMAQIEFVVDSKGQRRYWHEQ